jgi:inosine-uridine nucleoside N-ribohydrolase
MLAPMKRIAIGVVAAAAAFASPAQASTTRVILDTDLHADVDDAGALATLHSLEDRRETRLLAVMVNTPGRFGAPCADAIDTYHGRPNIPVGTLKPNDGSLAWKDYCKNIAESFPNDLKDGARAPAAVRLYRRVLRRQSDRDVTVISIGFERNLAQLLLSRGGRALVRHKVTRLVVMGGTYPSGTEYNFAQAPRSAALVARRWPTPIVYSGFELGEPILTGARLF